MDDNKWRSRETFSYKLQEFSQMTDRAMSPVFYVRNLPWRILVMRRWENRQDGAGYRSLSFYLQCNVEHQSTYWSCLATATLSILPVRPGVQPFSRRITHLFCPSENDWGFCHFIAWDDVVNPKNGLIEDDAVTLEVEDSSITIMNTKIPKLGQRPPIRIPKSGISSETKLSDPAKTNTGPPKVQFKAMALRRRSKSTSDLRIQLSKPSSTQLRQFKLPEKTSAVRLPQKRPALQKSDEENKPKVAKIKIPDWDYKSRFQELQKKYSAVQEDMKQIKPKIANLPALETELESLRKQTQQDAKKLEQFSQKEATLAQTNESLSKENCSIKNKVCELKASMNELKEANEGLEKKNENMLQKEILLDTKLTKMQTEFSELKQKHEVLENSHAQTLRTLASTEQDLNESKAIITGLQEDKSCLQDECAMLKNLTQQLKQDLEEHDKLRRTLHNTIQDMKGNIRVFCRVRPPVTKEENEKQLCSIFFPTESMLEIRKSRESVSVYGNKGQELKQEFTFDKVFPPEAHQEEVFEELSQLVQSALDGYHVCVFAYGQTGSGKTYTMQGSPSDHGMIPRTINLIFEKIKKLETSDWTYKVEASFLEIYNENIRDLLVPNSTHNYEVRFNEGRGVTVTNLTTISIKSALELKKLMDEAQKNRAVAATDFNEHSSRSHAVAKIYLEGYNTQTSATYAGSVNLVDLAGSESAKTSAAERLVETKNINKSLSTLGNVMLALHNHDSHVPYRNSKLTFLLQSCLGGNSKTLMFVNISPFEECFNESINSLRFAVKVKDVKTMAKKNKIYTLPSS